MVGWLVGDFTVGCGPAWNGLPLNTYISMYARTNRCYKERRLWAWNGLPLNTYIAMYARTNRCYNERRLWAWNGLPLDTYISMYARTNRCYNERRLWAWNGLPLNTYISMYARTNRCYNGRVLEPVTFVLAYHTVLRYFKFYSYKTHKMCLYLSFHIFNNFNI